MLYRLRAAERAGALLRLFDADGDGCLSFDEFRGESWELCGFDLVRGEACTRGGAKVEILYPLFNDSLVHVVRATSRKPCSVLCYRFYRGLCKRLLLREARHA